MEGETFQGSVKIISLTFAVFQHETTAFTVNFSTEALASLFVDGNICD